MSVNPNQSRSPPIPRAAESPRSPALPHLDYHPPDDDAPEQHHSDDGDDEDDAPYLEPGSEHTLLPPPNFQPFFTLIEDTTSGEHHHPYVHYVFADDEPSMVTATLMRSMGLDDTKYLTQDAQNQTERLRAQEGGSEDGEDSPVESPLPPPIPGVKERYMIIDLAADGRTIVDAQSLSPDWQITDRNIRTAPSFDENSPDQGFMLRIEGTEIPRNSKGKGKGQAGSDKLGEAREKSQDDIFGALDVLVGEIEGGLATAAKITGMQQREEQDTVGDVRAADVDAELPTET